MYSTPFIIVHCNPIPAQTSNKFHLASQVAIRRKCNQKTNLQNSLHWLPDYSTETQVTRMNIVNPMGPQQLSFVRFSDTVL